MTTDLTRRWDELLSLYVPAEEKAIEADDHENAGRRAYQVGWVHCLHERMDTALACSMRADTHWGSVRGFASRLRAVDYQRKAEYSATIAAFREVLKLFRSSSAENERVAQTLKYLAEVERTGGDLAAAERDYREALRVARAVNYKEGIVTCTSELAELVLDQKNWPEAETLAHEALHHLSERMDRQELIADNCHRLAQALIRQEKDGALPLARRAVDIYTLLGSPNLEDARATLRECES